MIMKEFTDIVLRAIDQRKKAGKLLIAIDGRCAAGKTTLAAHLREAIDCKVIHMDHFFLRPEQRTAERLGEPGGNVDYERVLSEVILPIVNGSDFSYRPYNCRSQGFDDAIFIRTGTVNIIEGSYSCHPSLKDYYDLRIFMSVDPETQLHRIRERGGDACVADFKDRWIPLEERYFTSCRVQDACSLRFFPKKTEGLSINIS